jgi:molecular chaperone GrpE
MSEQDVSDEKTGEAGVDIDEAPEGVDTEDIDLDDVAEGVVDDELVERVAEADPEDIAREIATLRDRADGLESEVETLAEDAEELEEKLKRKQAEFQNYKKRMDKRREEEQQRATEDLVSRILDVRDNLERALEQDEDTDIRNGVESTLRQLDDVLAAENVDVIDPEPGEDVDPSVHQVLANVESEEEPGAIADVHRPGYEMAEKVLREAQVTVSEE